MSPAVTEKKKYTYEDYLKTRENERYELIGGVLYMTPSPVTKHQRISRKIEFTLEKFVTENDLGEVFYAPYDVYLDDENVVQPDIIFISKERQHIIGEKNVQGAPDLVIEIISENSAYRDMVQKKSLYSKFGVKEYWVVIPEEASIEIYSLKENIYDLTNTYRKEKILESLNVKGLKIDLKEIF
jgi:Uma2 family endonuclease